MDDFARLEKRIGDLEVSNATLLQKNVDLERRVGAIEYAVTTLPEISANVRYIADTVKLVSDKQDKSVENIEIMKNTKADKEEVRQVKEELSEIKSQPIRNYEKVKWIVISAACSTGVTAIISALIATLT